MSCKYTSSPGPAGIECINPLMHMGPVKLDSARFSWKRDISVSTEFRTTRCSVLRRLSARNGRSWQAPRPNRETLLFEKQINVDTHVCNARCRVTTFSIDATRVLNAALIQKFTIIRARWSRATHLQRGSRYPPSAQIFHARISIVAAMPI